MLSKNPEFVIPTHTGVLDQPKHDWPPFSFFFRKHFTNTPELTAGGQSPCTATQITCTKSIGQISLSIVAFPCK